MSCGAECLSLGPPPDSILHMPPPPLPAFLVPPPANLTPPCPSVSANCPPRHRETDNALFPGVEYRELPRHDLSTGDDTWFLVLITCCVAVLCVAALLAIFLLKCKEAYTLRCSGRGSSKSGVKAGGSCLYGGGSGGGPALDSRVLWAALTPRGTRHFVADPYPHDEPLPADDHTYECVEPALYKLGPPPEEIIARHFDYEYEDPAPLIESYEVRLQEELLRAAAAESLRRARPLVSSPTRIERPNLPPLNVQPRTLRRQHARRVSDAAAPDRPLL